MWSIFVVCHPNEIIPKLFKYVVIWECCTHDDLDFFKEKCLLVSLLGTLLHQHKKKFYSKVMKAMNLSVASGWETDISKTSRFFLDVTWHLQTAF
jgi:hypothetical protein